MDEGLLHDVGCYFGIMTNLEFESCLLPSVSYASKCAIVGLIRKLHGVAVVRTFASQANKNQGINTNLGLFFVESILLVSAWVPQGE